MTKVKIELEINEEQFGSLKEGVRVALIKLLHGTTESWRIAPLPLNLYENGIAANVTVIPEELLKETVPF
jgi:hypothetical protein